MPGWEADLTKVEPVRIAGILFRLVESQEQIATNQLVGSLERQAMLEEMLEATKPARRKETERLHYLLATPFRYPPLKHGSRFGKRNEPSLFYGSLAVSTVLAEAVNYRFGFWFGMATPPKGKLLTQHTVFGARYQTEKGLRLQVSPFDQYRPVLSCPSDYSSSQKMGEGMCAAGVDAFEFHSARDPDEGINVALFSPRAFARNAPVSLEPWLCELSAERVRFRAAYGRGFHEFSVEMFEVDGKLPQPALLCLQSGH